MRCISTAILLLTACLHAAAGDTLRYEYKGRWVMKLAPLSVIDIKHPLMMVGAEYYFGKRLSAGIEGGVPVTRAYTDGDLTVLSDWKARVDLRYYFNDDKPYRGFIALRGLYRCIDFKSGIMPVPMFMPPDQVFYGRVRGSRLMNGIGVYMGGVMVRRRVLFEWHAGLVLYSLDVRLQQPQSFDAARSPDVVPLIAPALLNYYGTTRGVYPSVGFRMGFMPGRRAWTEAKQ